MSDEGNALLMRQARWVAEGRMLVADLECEVANLKRREKAATKALKEAVKMLGKDDDMPAIAEKD
jgi:hypothetical protein